MLKRNKEEAVLNLDMKGLVVIAGISNRVRVLWRVMNNNAERKILQGDML